MSTPAIHVSTAVVNNWDSLLLENNDGEPEFRCLEEIDESVDVGSVLCNCKQQESMTKVSRSFFPSHLS